MGGLCVGGLCEGRLVEWEPSAAWEGSWVCVCGGGGGNQANTFLRRCAGCVSEVVGRPVRGGL